MNPDVDSSADEKETREMLFRKLREMQDRLEDGNLGLSDYRVDERKIEKMGVCGSRYVVEIEFDEVDA